MGDSPVWKRPSDVMKIHRSRKSLSQKRITTDPEKRTSIIYKSPSKAIKRRNPFSCHSTSEQPAKRHHTDNKENKLQSDAANCELFGILDAAGKTETTPSTGQCQQTQEDSNQEDQLQNETTDSEKVVPSAKHERTEPGSDSGPYIPVDWCLKTKLRVVSSRPLDWCAQLKSTDEAQGVISFVQDDRCLMESIEEQKRLFQRSCLYWIHPNLPWVRLFPRILDDSRFSKDFSPLMQDDIQRSLQADWQQSFTSAYHQLRSGLCPYFYLCTHQFTVLFHHEQMAQSKMVALMTPTTRGFRESLDTEGIPFKLPVYNKRESPDKLGSTAGHVKDHTVDGPVDDQADTNKKEDDDEDDLLETDDAASGWLESMGLDKKEFPSLDPKKVKLQREGFRVIDNRPESLVCIEGSDVQAFVNFLLNCRTCTATSGAQAGVPPTVLSPTPFKGATLKSQKVKHTAVKQSDRDGNISQAHIVEVTGALLPHHCRSLVSLYHHTQRADFGVVYNNHDPTVPFNILPKLPHMKNNSSASGNHVDSCHGDSDSNKGIPDSKSQTLSDLEDTSNKKCEGRNVTAHLDIDRFYRNVPVSDGVRAIKELVCTTDKFSWTT